MSNSVGISHIRLTTDLGSYTMPVVEVDTPVSGVDTITFKAGDKLAFSMAGYLTDQLFLYSVFTPLTTQYTNAFNFIGSEHSYIMQMAVSSNGRSVYLNRKKWLSTDLKVLYWEVSNSTTRICSNYLIIKGTDGKYLLTSFQIWLPSSSVDFSVNPPAPGEFGDLVIDFLSNSYITVQSYQSAQTATLVRITNDLMSNEYIPPPSDPYSQGGESGSGGGTGNFDGTSVDVDFTSLPTLSAVDTGFITLYNPTLAQLQSLANYMWSGLFDIDTFKKLFADPMQAILGLSIVPGPVPGGATQNVKIGNIDSGVSMTKAATQYIDIDCGTLNVEEFWGAYLDYEPYTKAEIFLPFIGVHQIAIDDIMNKAVQIKYHIDLLSGACACEIKCGGSVLYTFIGSCAVSIPVTGSDWTNLLNGVLSAASAIGTMVATGGASAPAAASTIASAAVNSLKPSIEKSGSIAGAGGLLAGKVPVLILTRPRQALPGKQNTFTGYPAFITRSLGALSGYTEVHSIRLSGIDGTESEIDEIEELLKGGVIL